MVVFVIIYNRIVVVPLKYHHEYGGKAKNITSVDTHVILFSLCPKMRMLVYVY